MQLKNGMVVLGLATSHHKENAGTFSPPYCLVFVGQDRQWWVPGPLRKLKEENVEPKNKSTEQPEVLHLCRWSTHTHTRIYIYIYIVFIYLFVYLCIYIIYIYLMISIYMYYYVFIHSFIYWFVHLFHLFNYWFIYIYIYIYIIAVPTINISKYMQIWVHYQAEQNLCP